MTEPGTSHGHGNQIQISESQLLLDDDEEVIYRRIKNRHLVEDTQHLPLTEEDFRARHQYQPKQPEKISEIICRELKCSPHTILNLFPILKWLPKYNIKEDLLNDVIAGTTIAIMQISQGLAYALLANVPPIIGIYMAFFPVWIYIVMGTSRHLSMGAFAVLCIMVNSVVAQHASTTNYTPTQVSAAISLIVGIWQCVLGILRLGVLSFLFTESLISGFTTAIAVYVLSSQIKHLLGISVQRFSGPFKIIYTFIDIFHNLPKVNFVAVGLSSIFIVVLICLNEFLKPRLLQKHKRFILPSELAAIIVGTLLSKYLQLESNHNINTIGEIPIGFPTPSSPPVDLLLDLALDGFILAVVSIAMNISLAKMFAIKADYKISCNQEFLAYGFGNIFGSFFSCLPYAAALSRCAIQYNIGGRTQITSVVSCTLLIFVLLFLGPFFEPLPQCVLASIVVVSLKGMLCQVRDLPKFYKLNKPDALIWILTFTSVLCLDIHYGLTIGVLSTICTLIVQTQRPYFVELGRVPNTHLYLDLKTYKTSSAVDDILILKIMGGINFSNCHSLFHQIKKMVQNRKVPCLILDLSVVSYLDPTAAKSLLAMFKDLSNDCQLFLTQCSNTVYSTLNKCVFFDEFPIQNVLSDIHDVVIFVKEGQFRECFPCTSNVSEETKVTPIN